MKLTDLYAASDEICLYCAGPRPARRTLADLLGLNRPDPLCAECRSQLPLLHAAPKTSTAKASARTTSAAHLSAIAHATHATTCPTCSRPQPHATPCNDCRRWSESAHWHDLITHNISLYAYNDFLKDYIARWKYRGDAVLATAFRHDLLRTYRKHFDRSIAVPIPLSTERHSERGFNQSEQLTDIIAAVAPTRHYLTRTSHEQKQSKRSRHSRLHDTTSRPFELAAHPEQIHAKHFVLIDDIYTTGLTVRKAARPLIEAGAASVAALTVARS
ncbi:ComF family protein [Salsuginibacillus kocurii]|uniref:ComF family protein n=1 Tax=Salsuginibacillus kocurii TaxID=427078 RepID=UPI0003A58B67|nr:phosphoribosyltransferase family protein [Salsuginibacillus kocurii]